jgi:hypothetical protein
METALTITIIVAVFVAFGITLAWADFQTKKPS